jgi:hypothetical protein
LSAGDGGAVPECIPGNGVPQISQDLDEAGFRNVQAEHGISDEKGVVEREGGRDLEVGEVSAGSLRGTPHKAHT